MYSDRSYMSKVSDFVHLTLRGSLAVFNVLLEKGADATVLVKKKRKLIHLVCLGGNQTILSTLLKKQNPNVVDEEGVSPLHNAVFKGHQGFLAHLFFYLIK